MSSREISSSDSLRLDFAFVISRSAGIAQSETPSKPGLNECQMPKAFDPTQSQAAAISWKSILGAENQRTFAMLEVFVFVSLSGLRLHREAQPLLARVLVA